MPDRLKSIVPSIDYLPARQGTTLTLKPWYGYEAEEQMRGVERNAIKRVCSGPRQRAFRDASLSGGVISREHKLSIVSTSALSRHIRVGAESSRLTVRHR